MHPEAQTFLDRFAERYVATAPEGWVRIVVWTAKTADTPEQASLDVTATVAEVITRAADGTLQQTPLRPASSPTQDLLQLERLEQGQPEEGWLLLKMVADRGQAPEFDFDRETHVTTEDSVASGWADEVRHHLERHRDELEALAGAPGQGAVEPRRGRWNLFRS